MRTRPHGFKKDAQGYGGIVQVGPRSVAVTWKLAWCRTADLGLGGNTQRVSGLVRLGCMAAGKRSGYGTGSVYGATGARPGHTHGVLPCVNPVY